MRFAKFVKIRQEKFGAVVFDTLKEKVYLTNEVGGQILKSIEDGRGEDEILKSLKDSYDADAFKIQNEATSFIEQLKKNNLVEVK